MGNRAAVRPQTARPRVARSQAAWPAAGVGASWAAQQRPVGAAVAGTRVCGRREARPEARPGTQGPNGTWSEPWSPTRRQEPGVPETRGRLRSVLCPPLCLPLWLEGFPRKRPRVTRASRSRVTPVCHALLPRTGPDVSLCAASRAPPGRGPGHRRRVGTEAARPGQALLPQPRLPRFPRAEPRPRSPLAPSCGPAVRSLGPTLALSFASVTTKC